MGRCDACTAGVAAHWVPVLTQQGPFPLTEDLHTIQSLCPLTLPGWTQAYEHATRSPRNAALQCSYLHIVKCLLWHFFTKDPSLSSQIPLPNLT